MLHKTFACFSTHILIKREDQNQREKPDSSLKMPPAKPESDKKSEQHQHIPTTWDQSRMQSLLKSEGRSQATYCTNSIRGAPKQLLLLQLCFLCRVALFHQGLEASRRLMWYCRDYHTQRTVRHTQLRHTY